MKPLFKLELNYFPSLHLSQIYDGLTKLRRLGIIHLSLKPVSDDTSKPLLTVKIDNKHKVIYDTLDGLNWINGSIEENLNHFKKNVEADFYFKRSYNQQVLDYAPKNCKVYPLGLNYNVKPENSLSKNLREKIKTSIESNFIIEKFFKKTSFYSKEYECYPIPSRESRILFFTRLWDPNEISLDHLRSEREFINKNRISCIKACQKEFGKLFVGGLQKNNFAVQHSKELIIDSPLTNKENFLLAVKNHNICVATTGLHSSIGWKFGEYVAASRAIISEPLAYKIPGDFENGNNYFVFNNEDELLNKADYLLNNKEALLDMMISNFHYYNNHLRPEVLVLNTILKIYQEK